MAQFPNIINTTCIPTTPPPPDPRCADPAFALANPGICSTTPVLILKPSTVLSCSLGSVQFQLYQDLAGMETKLTSGVVYSSSNPAVALISASTGNCTGVAAGEVTITATYQNQSATASLTVMGSSGAQGCCGETTVATMLLVDTSKSMSSVFGSGYTTREAYAQALATQYAQQVNVQKGDTIGLVSFDATATTVVAPGNSIAAVTSAIAALNYTQNETSIGLGLQAAIAALAGVTADIYVIVLISDGENEDSNIANDPITIATGWQSASNIIICAGVRASETDNGFNLLNGIATGGFFVNSYPSIAATSLTTVTGLKGYICAGNCVPPGNIYEAEGQLDYTGFKNWNVTNGEVDLFGNGFYDLLPGNGLYVNMESVLYPNQPATGIQTKNSYSFVPGKTYSLSLKVAGNQTTTGNFAIQATIVSATNALILQQQVNITDYTQGFQTYTFNFTVPAAINGYIFIGNINNVSGVVQSNVLIDNVVLTDVTDLVTMFSDNFDTENIQFIPPGCGTATSGMHTQNVPFSSANYDSFGRASIPTGALVPGVQYTIQFGANDSELVVDDFFDTLHIFGPTTQTFTPSAGGSGDSYLIGTANTAITATITYQAPIYYYGYAGCYGYGCLSSPPGDQMPDPNPLPDIESGATGQTPYTSTQTVTVYCPSGTQQVGGGTTGATGTATYTSYISQQNAINNATALATFNAKANLAQIGCQTVYTSTQSYTAQCPVAQYGPPVTASATATSTVSQAAANSAALAQAQAGAMAQLACTFSNNLLPILPPAGEGGSLPYPSVQYVSGKTGLVTLVTVQLNTFLTTYCENVLVLLTSPSGRSCILFCNIGGNHSIAGFGVNLNIEDAAASSFSNSVVPTAGSYKPTQFAAGGGAFVQGPFWGVAPAPQPNFGLTLANFIGDNPNGSWALWVFSSAALNTGSIASWGVTIASA